MKLVNMIESPEEEMKEQQPIYRADMKPAYPYELQISLDDDDLKKLGVEDLPDIGAVIELEAKVLVTRIVDENGFYGRNRCLGLQITDMALGAPSDPDADDEAEDAADGGADEASEGE